MRGLVSGISPGAWTLVACGALSGVGSGLTLPFLLVYLHQVRELPVGAAGLVVATVALAGFAGNPAGGSLADRAGPRATLLVGLCFAAAGSVSLAFVTQAWQAFAAAAALGFGLAVVWPARNGLLATVVPVERRGSAYGLEHAATNAGLGTGALLAALIVDNSSPASFQLLFLLDAASFLVVVPFVSGVRTPAAAEQPARDAVRCGGYREIVRDRAFRWLWVLTALLVTVGYAQYTAAFPAVATNWAGLDAHGLALCFATNSVAVVLCQLPVLRLLGARRRTTALAFVFAATATSWAVVLAACDVPAPAAALPALMLAMIVLALGETALSPTAPALANALAPEPLRGRYNGVYTLAWSTGFAAGPALAGVALAAGQPSALLLALIAACALGVAGSLRLARQLPPAVDVVDDRDACPATLEPAIA